MHACILACNFCRQAIGFASKITKIIRNKSKRPVKQSKESQCETAKYVTLNTSVSSFSAVDYSSRSFLSILSFTKELSKLILRAEKYILKLYGAAIFSVCKIPCGRGARDIVRDPYDVIQDGAEKADERRKRSPFSTTGYQVPLNPQD